MNEKKESLGINYFNGRAANGRSGVSCKCP
jgi:hypothetical protein